MKTGISLLMLFCLPFIAQAQDSWTIDGGISNGHIKSDKMSRLTSMDGYRSYTLTGRLQWRRQRPLMLGVSLALQPASATAYADYAASGSDVSHHSTYAYIAPMLGLSFGRGRFVQFNAIPAMGIKLKGNTTLNYTGRDPATGSTIYYHTSIPTRALTSRLTLELQEQIPLHPNWRITLSEALDLPLGMVASTDAGSIKLSGYSLRIGIRHIRHYPKPEEMTE